MTSLRLVLAIAALAIAAPLGVTAQEPPAAAAPVTPADYGKWESLGQATLSPDGRWLAYAVNRGDEENELRIRGLARDTTLVVKHGAAPGFSGDSRWLAYSIRPSPAQRERLQAQRKPVRNQVGIVNLATLETVVLDDVASFQFSGDGRFLALRGYPPEGRRDGGADLIIRDLAAGTMTNFGNVTGFAWSDRGALLALTVRTEGGAGNGVHLYDARSGTIRVLDSSESIYRALAWRKDADDLAVLRARAEDGFRDTTHVVLAWSRAGSDKPTRRELDPAAAPGFPDGMRVAEHATPRWSRDGATLFIGIRPREPKPRPAKDTAATALQASRDDAAAPTDTTAAAAAAPAGKPSDVQVWHARDVRIMPQQKAQEQQDLRRTMLTAWHLRDDRVVRIGTDLHENVTVLEGDRRAIETDRKPYAFENMFGRRTHDVWLVDVRTGEREKVLEGIRWFHGASAGGRYLTWFDGEDFWTHDVETGRRTNLTARVDADFANANHDYPVEAGPAYGVAGWTRGDRALLVYDRYDIWSLAPDGSGGRRLTDGAGERVVHRYLRTARDEEGIDVARPLHLSLAGERSKRTGFARLAPGRAPERLIFEDARLWRFMRADSTDVFAYVRERFDSPPNWHVGGPRLADARRVTEINPFHSDYAWGRAELVDFTTGAGNELQAALIYPAGYEPGRRYPMLVYTYERLSQNVHNYVVPSERSYYNFAVFSAQGYFVLMPDIVYRPGDPGVSALDAVESAVAAVLDRGMVDPARIGLIGHSWGGYQATYLPTRTRLFAASVAGAPITNFLSFAGAVHWTPGFPELDHWETGQARMGAAPWEDFEAHVRNSPAAWVHELETPMLMMFGDADGTVDWHQGIEFYNFARRAGKQDFILLVYPGEDHGLRKKENQIDYHRRILEWFGHWLKGEPAPKWMTEGVSWLERKRMLDEAGAQDQRGRS